MTAIPVWPHEEGPRVLTLAGHDLTFEARARKTAASLARSGFAVIALGVDESGANPRQEDLDGALVHRVVPPTDSRVSARMFRLSRPELAEAFRYRRELHRTRLALRRRNFGGRPPDPLRLARLSQALWSGLARLLPIDRAARDRVYSGLGRRVAAVERRTSEGVRRMPIHAERGRFLASSAAHRALAQPSRSVRRGRWRRDLPELHRWEAALGGVIDALKPDLIHVHDVFHLGVAVRAKRRAAKAGRRMAVVYDAHEFVPGLPTDPRRRAGLVDLEEEYARWADAVVTVSPGLARLCEERFELPVTVVLNAPDMERAVSASDLREVAGIGPEVPVITYVGGLAPDRGAEDLVEAVTRLEEAIHLVFVANTTSGYVDTLRKAASRLDIGHRVHFVPFVPQESVVAYIRSADVSVIPLSRAVPNYEVALPNKLFQSIQARVPVVVSDNPDLAAFVDEHPIGEVFTSGDVDDLSRAIRAVLDDRPRYEAALDEPSLVAATDWAAQNARLVDLYRRLGVGLDD